MKLPTDRMFYDLCCGSGAVSLAAIEAGHPPDRIVMVDQGPFGLFWRSIGEGSFDIATFEQRCAAIPTDRNAIKDYIEKLFASPVEHPVYDFLILQATAIGGCPISITNGAWQRSSGFRDYWLPTATSSRRYPVNPMMPMPETLLARVKEIAQRARGVQGFCADAQEIEIDGGSIVYIDPPYDDTTGYGRSIDAPALAQRIAITGSACFVSEGRALSDNAILIANGRAKGGVTGDRKRAPHEEWLSCFALVAEKREKP